MPILSPIPGGAISPAGAALLDTALTSANAQMVYSRTELVDLWIPELWLDEAGVRKLVGAKNYRRMAPLTGTEFPVITPNLFGTRTGLVASGAGGDVNTIGDLANPDSIMPTNRSYTVVCGCYPNTTPDGLGQTSQYPWGTNGASATYHWFNANGSVRIYSMGVLQVFSASSFFGTQPYVTVVAYKHSDTAESRSFTLRANKAQIGNKVNVPDAQVNTNSQFQLFAFGNGGTLASQGLKLGPVMLFDGIALTDAEHAPLLAATESFAYTLMGMT